MQRVNQIHLSEMFNSLERRASITWDQFQAFKNEFTATRSWEAVYVTPVIQMVVEHLPQEKRLNAYAEIVDALAQGPQSSQADLVVEFVKDRIETISNNAKGMSVSDVIFKGYDIALEANKPRQGMPMT
ncbi:MAG TPA: hypothetical protein VIN59_01745 [Alphaproteobacteria bacterium]